MKISLGGGSDGLKDFFIEHGEKIGFGVFVAAVLYFIYGAFQHDVYQGRPQELKQKVSLKDSTIRSNNPQAAEMLQVTREITPYSEKVDETSVPLQVGMNRINVPLDINHGTIIGTKRSQPKLLAVEEVKATASVGSFAYVNPNVPVGGQGNEIAPGNQGVLPGGVPPGTPPGVAPGTPPGVAPGTYPGGQPGDDAASNRFNRRGKGNKGKGGIPGPPGEGNLEGMLENIGGAKGGGLPGLGGDVTGDFSTQPCAGVVPPSGSIAKGKLVVMVVAKVPLKEQTNEFMRVFKDCKKTDPILDVPQYVTFVIERADVTDGKPPVFEGQGHW